jgi:exo-beta-1,3-glucanase (GH17 family)
LTSSDIVKAGFGIMNDACVIWEDLRTDMRSIADVGLMIRLWKVDDHWEENFQPIAMDHAVKVVLGVTIDKTYQKADWKIRPHEGKKLCE